MNLLNQIILLIGMVFIIPAFIAVFGYICKHVLKNKEHGRMIHYIGLIFIVWVLTVTPSLMGVSVIVSLTSAIASLYATVATSLYNKYMSGKTQGGNFGWVGLSLLSLCVLGVTVITYATALTIA